MPFGDAICRVNPSYGQGMSIAAQEAVLLAQALATLRAQGRPLAALAAAFFDGLAGLLQEPWDIAQQDYAYPHLVHARPAGFAAHQAMRGAIGRLAARDPEIHRLSVEVAQLLRPASVWRDAALRLRIEQEVARPAAAPRHAAGQAPKRRGALPSSAESASSKGE